jgi:hypothetical protein
MYVGRSAIVRNNKLIVFNEYEKNQFRKTIDYERLKQISSTNYQGEIKFRSRRLIEKRFDAWFRSLQVLNKFNETHGIRENYRFVMVTLTLCAKQFHNDKYIKLKMLKPFIKKMEKDYKVQNWAWKAESQKNGNIHFHIVIDKFVPKKWINKTWETYLDKMGYLKIFQEKTNKKHPPAANVLGQDKMLNPVSYLTKYYVKEEVSRKINGALWRMSDKLLKLQNFTYNLSWKEENNILKTAEIRKATVVHEEHFSIIIFKEAINESYISKECQLKADKFYLDQGLYLSSNDPNIKPPKQLEKTPMQKAVEAEEHPLKSNLDAVQLFIPNFQNMAVRRFDEFS